MTTTTVTATTARVGAPSNQKTAAAARPARENARGLAALLLAASVAALAVVADQLIDTWADGHLMLAWIVLWAVVFLGSLLLTGSIRRMASRLMDGLNGWARRRALARAESRFLAMARTDSRLMADIKAARDRADLESALQA